MQKSTRITLDQLLFAAAFLLALAVRLLRLAQAPLSDPEAELALQALGLARGSLEGALTGQPGYILPTTALFAIFGAGSGLARLAPALAGAGLALLPALFRRELGDRAAVILAFGLALDPGLTALSRQAGGFTWAALCGLLSFAGLRRNKAWLAGISLGLALLAGAHFWQGLLGAGIGYGLSSLLSLRTNREVAPAEDRDTSSGGFWKQALIAAAASLVLGGSLFLFVPRGISAAGSGLVEFLSGWSSGAGASLPRLLLALAVYETFALVFGLIQVVRVIVQREKQPVDLVLIVWWAAAALVGLVFPARSELSLGWALIPIWALAARWLADVLLRPGPELGKLAAGHAVALFALGIFIWMNLIALLDAGETPDEARVRWAVAVGVFMLASASVLLVGWGWSKSAAGYASLWSGAALLALWSVSACFSAAGLSRYPETQMWRTGPLPLEEDLLMRSIGDASEWNTGLENMLDLAVVQVPSPALKWALRDYLGAEYYDVTPVGVAPSLAVTYEQTSPGLAGTYRGQDFRWTSEPGWSSLTTMDWFRWALFKKAPLNSKVLIFWVRTDRFPGSAPEPE